MGICCSAKHTAEHKEIETLILYQKKIDREIKKLLLLGAGSSGKSTLFRQLRCIHGWGFEDSDYRESLRAIRQNCVTGMIKLLKKSDELYEKDPEEFELCRVDIEEKDTQKAIEMVVKYTIQSFEFTEELEWDEMEVLGESIDYLWKLEAIQHTFHLRSNRFSFPDNMDIFFSRVKDIMREDYSPTGNDVLRCRIRTTGIMERTYEIKDAFISIFDVGGQRNERKKWIHCFEGVTAVIYVAALNHYKQVLFEDEAKNAMHESLQLFEEICNSKWFRKTPMILFLNKDDLFKEALREPISLSCCFSRDAQWKGDIWTGPDYYPGNKQESAVNTETDTQYFSMCYSTAVQFVTDQYIKCDKSHLPFKQRRVFPHVTTATDRGNIERVFWDCQNIVVRGNLMKGGLV